MAFPKVLVFINTYNGEKYLKIQIDSILNQKGVDAYFAIRDDGSSDDTIDIIKEYQLKYPNRFTLFLGENMGPSGSMKTLLLLADNVNYDYYAISDQDDYWLPEKLVEGVKAIDSMNAETPRFYFSNLTITDKDLNPRFKAYGKKDVTPTPGACFVDFHASGNTYIFDNKAMNFLREATPPESVYGDVWYCLLCIFLCSVKYDENSYIYFRRTGQNASGNREKGIKQLYSRAKRLKRILAHRDNAMRKEMAQHMLNKYGGMLDIEKREILELIAGYQDRFINKLKLLFSPRIKSKSFTRNVHMYVRVIMNQF